MTTLRDGLEGSAMLYHLNLALRFALELCGIAALAFASYQFTTAPFGALSAAISVAAFITIWATLVAPRSASPLRQTTRHLLGAALLLMAGALLASAGQPWLGGGFAALVVANEAIHLHRAPAKLVTR